MQARDGEEIRIWAASMAVVERVPSIGFISSMELGLPVHALGEFPGVVQLVREEAEGGNDLVAQALLDGLRYLRLDRTDGPGCFKAVAGYIRDAALHPEEDWSRAICVADERWSDWMGVGGTGWRLRIRAGELSQLAEGPAGDQASPTP